MAFSLTGILSVLLEVIRPYLPVLAVLLLVELGLIVLVLKRIGRGLRFAAAVRVSLVFGGIVGLAAALLAPMWTGATLGQLSPVIDYIAFIGIALGGTVAAAIALYPMMQIVVGSRS